MLVTSLYILSLLNDPSWEDWDRENCSLGEGGQVDTMVVACLRTAMVVIGDNMGFLPLVAAYPYPLVAAYPFPLAYPYPCLPCPWAWGIPFREAVDG